MPFNSLPNEVAQAIFEHTLEDKPRVHPLQPPLLLTQITRQWREIALSTPSLWANFSFGGPDTETGVENIRAFDAPVQRPREELLELWLARSGALPLHFALEFLYADEAGARVMNLLLAQSHRWRDVQFTFFAAAFVALDQAPTGSYPLLQTLLLSNSARTLGDGAEHDISITPGKVPILRRVTLDGFTHTQVHLPWHQLTHLDFSSTWGIDDTLEVLRPCTQIESFTCFWCLPGSEATTLGGLAPITKLRHLDITTQNLLSSLTLPALTHLRIKSLIFMGVDPADVIVAMVARSGCAATLESLIIDESQETGEGIFALLRLLPVLKHLSLRLDHHSEAGALLMLSTQLADETCCPNLETLVVRAWSKAEHEVRELLPALVLRSSRGLKRVEITLQTRISLVTPPESPNTNDERFYVPEKWGDADDANLDAHWLDNYTPPVLVDAIGAEAFRQRHRDLVAAEVATQFLALPLEMRLVTSRPDDGLGPSGSWLKPGDINVIVDTWSTRGCSCRCSFCVDQQY